MEALMNFLHDHQNAIVLLTLVFVVKMDQVCIKYVAKKRSIPYRSMTKSRLVAAFLVYFVYLIVWPYLFN